jgi:multidrug resistance efflux pump
MRSKLTTLASLILSGALLCGCSAVSRLTERAAQPTATPDTLSVSGTIEAEQVTVAAELGGRIVSLSADEGDTVTGGQALVQIDGAALRAQRGQAQAGVEQAQAALDGARAQLALASAGARVEELDAAESGVSAAQANLAAAEARAEAAASHLKGAEAGLAAAQGQLTTAQAAHEASQAAVDVARAQLSRALKGASAEDIAIAERAVEAAKNARWGAQAQRDAICGHIGATVTQADCDVAQAAVQQAEEQVRIAELQLQQASNGASVEDIAALRAGLTQAQAGADGAAGAVVTAQANVDAASAAVEMARADHKAALSAADAAEAQRDQAQAGLDLLKAGARAEQLDVLRAGVAQAQAALAGAQAALAEVDTKIGKLNVAAPSAGIVLDRLVAVGELATQGAPLLTLANLDQVTLTVYVPEADLGRVRLGQAAEVTVDSYSDTFAGLVTHIARRAEFTPKNVDTREERVNMVFAVEITLENADHRLLPGMPADALLR